MTDEQKNEIFENIRTAVVEIARVRFANPDLDGEITRVMAEALMSVPVIDPAAEREINNKKTEQNAAEIRASIPAWTDPVVGRDELNEVRDYLLGQGYGEPEVTGMNDPRLFKLAYYAMKYEQQNPVQPGPDQFISAMGIASTVAFGSDQSESASVQPGPDQIISVESIVNETVVGSDQSDAEVKS
jgi:hypothetical protein